MELPEANLGPSDQLSQFAGLSDLALKSEFWETGLNKFKRFSLNRIQEVSKSGYKTNYILIFD